MFGILDVSSKRILDMEIRQHMDIENCSSLKKTPRLLQNDAKQEFLLCVTDVLLECKWQKLIYFNFILWS